MVNIHFITQGCSANTSDTEIMKALVYKAGYDITEHLDNSDLVIFNTCTVKGPTESFFKKKLKELRKKNKKIIITGCIPQSEKNLDDFSDCSILGTFQTNEIVPVIRETLKGRIVVNLSREKETKVLVPKIRKNELIDIVQISTGCTDNCSFCKTKFAKGNIRSERIRDIREQIQNSVNNGIKEIWLTSQDNGAYGLDIGTNLIELLNDITKIEGNFKVRIGMANPHHILNFLDELIWIIKDHKKFFHFLHIPIQSGSNKILKDMKRPYTVEDYIFIYKRLKEELPFISLSNDIIVGYPTETERDFKDTFEFIKNFPTDVMNISRFWPRPGTVASKLKVLPGSKVKERSRKITELFYKLAKKDNEKWIGWEGEVFIDEIGKEGTFVGRNYSYKPIIIKSNLDLLGKTFRVRVEKAEVHDLRGYILEEL